MRRVEAVGNREHVKHRADVAYVQMCGPAGDVHVSAIGGVFSAPQEERAGRDPRVIRVGAKLASDAVKSYKPESAPVMAVVQSHENAAHEAHVAMEVVRGALAGVEIRAGAREQQIGLGDHAAEIGDDRGIVAGIGEIRVSGRSAFDRAREEKMTGAGDVRDWPGPGGAISARFIVRPSGSDLGAERKPRPGARRASEEPAATQTQPGKVRPRC